MKKNIFFLLLCSFVSALSAIVLYRYLVPETTIIIHEKIPSQPVAIYEAGDVDFEKPASLNPDYFVDAATQSVKAVVYIRSVKSSQDKIFNRNYNSASGSGVIVSSEGFIVTNNHVIKDAKTIEITLNDKREYEAKLIGSDASTDLALLKISEMDLPYLTLGNSDAVQIGEWVLAVGNPFRLHSTVTAGIVSAKARNINILERSDIESFIQTDAAVNPGNSGGALINTHGELIGINTAIITNSGGYEGFSFAIPSNIVSKAIYDFKEYGAVQRGWLGVTISNVDDKLAKTLNLSSVSGILIENVNSQSAAREAGLKRNDVLLEVNGTSTSTTPEFMEQIARYRPGDELNLKVMRNGKTFVTRVTLRNHLNTTDYVAIRRDPILLEVGFELRDLNSDERGRLQENGVMVVSIQRGSLIDETNMEPNYVITSINEKRVESVQDMVNILSKTDGLIELEGFYEEYPGKFPYRFYLK